MHPRMRQALLFTTLVMVVVGTTLAQFNSAEVGTWKLNLDKSNVQRRPGTQEGYAYDRVGG